MVNSVPQPSLEPTEISPPCFSTTIRRTTAKPSSVPFLAALVVSDLSNTFSHVAFVIPVPLS